MKALIVLVALAIFPSIEQSIYKPVPPFENTKKSFYVRERERPLLNLVSEASTSIARFLQEVHYTLTDTPGPAISQVLAEARAGLRLPPLASVEGTTRFVDSTLYCWSSKDQDHLEFLIEWADITTDARYTDSYVFVRRGPSWYFEKHGSIQPWYWAQTERYFQRACPSPD